MSDQERDEHQGPQGPTLDVEVAEDDADEVRGGLGGGEGGWPGFSRANKVESR